MKTLDDLEKRLAEYRLKQIGLPSYAELSEFLQSMKSNDDDITAYISDHELISHFSDDEINATFS